MIGERGEIRPRRKREGKEGGGLPAELQYKEERKDRLLQLSQHRFPVAIGEVKRH
jgi:hypothetical protein